mgnify:FL=1
MNSQEERLTSDQLLRLSEVADRLQVSRSTVRRIVKEGRLRTVRVSPRSVRVRPQDLEAFIRESLEERRRA